MKLRKTILVSAVLTAFSCITVFANTNEKEYYDGDYGYAKLEVSSNGGMRDCYAWTGSCPYNDNYDYKVNVIITYQDGSTSVGDTGYNEGYALVDRPYEWAEDYVSTNYVREGTTIRGRIQLSGS